MRERHLLYLSDVPVDRQGHRQCPVCVADPPSKAFRFAAVYGAASVMLAIGAWASAGAVRIALIVVAGLLAAVAAWTFIVVAVVKTVAEAAERKRGRATERTAHNASPSDYDSIG